MQYSASQQPVLFLSGECTINELNDRYEQIVSHWKDQSQSLLMDFSMVTAVDESFMELLSIFQSTARQNKTQCYLINFPNLY